MRCKRYKKYFSVANPPEKHIRLHRPCSCGCSVTIAKNLNLKNLAGSMAGPNDDNGDDLIEIYFETEEEFKDAMKLSIEERKFLLKLEAGKL